MLYPIFWGANNISSDARLWATGIGPAWGRGGVNEGRYGVW